MPTFMSIAIDITIKISVLLIATFVLTAVLRRSSAAVRHRLWCLAFCGALAVPFLSAVIPHYRIAVLPARAVADESQLAFNATDVAPIPVPENQVEVPRGLNADGTGTGIQRMTKVWDPSMFDPAMESHATSNAERSDEITLPDSSLASKSLADESGGGALLADAQSGPSSIVWPILFWLIGVVLFLLPLVLGAMGNVRFLLRGSHVMDESWLELMQQTREALGIKRPVRLVELSEDCVPMTFGIIRPIVILPASSARWSSQRKRMVLLHELAHIKRWDLPFQLLARIACAVYWFNPLAWLALNRLRIEREQACDDCVVATGQRATDYAQELVSIARSHAVPRMSLAVGMARSSKLEHRLVALFDRARSHLPLSTRRARLLLVAVLLMVTGIVAIRPVQRSAEAQDQLEVNGRSAAEEGSARNETDEESEKASSEANFKAHKDESIPVPADQDNPTIEETPLARVTGVVKSADGQPITKARLAVVAWSHLHDSHRRTAPPVEVWATSTTLPNGRFEMHYRLPRDPQQYIRRTYQLAVLAAAEGHGQGWHFMSLDDEESTVTLRLQKQQLRRGRLVDLEGRPVQDALLSVSQIGTPAPAETYAHAVGPGIQGWTVDEVYMTQVPSLASAKGSTNGRDIWEGGVQFYLPRKDLDCWPRPIRTDHDGRFVLRGIGDQSAVTLRLEGNRQAGSQELKLAAGDDQEKVFACEAPRLIIGSVTDDRGAPIAGACVRVVPTGATTYAPTLGVVADWKGRQGHASTAHIMPSAPPLFMEPPVECVTDAEGRFEISPMNNPIGPQRFVVIVSSPEEQSWMPSRQTIVWPKKTTFSQELSFQLTPGVRVAGRVIDSNSGQPVAHARIDFWSRELPYPTDYIEQLTWETSPDGVIHPPWRKTDDTGRFQITVPRGTSYLCVNRGTEDCEVDSIAASDLGVVEGKYQPMPNWSFVTAPGSRPGHPLRYYPDRLVKLDYDGDKSTDEVEVSITPADKVTIHLRSENGSIPREVHFFGSQVPFREMASGQLACLKHIGKQTYTIAKRHRDLPVSVAFFDEQTGQGICADLDEAGQVTLRMKPFGNATATIVDADGVPLADYRPLLVMSLPAKPYTTARGLEKLALDSRIPDHGYSWRIVNPYDVIWQSVTAYGEDGVKTDSEGRIKFTKLIPGATYRLLKLDGSTHDFVATSGPTKDLGTIQVKTSDSEIVFPPKSKTNHSLISRTAVYEAPTNPFARMQNALNSVSKLAREMQPQADQRSQGGDDKSRADKANQLVSGRILDNDGQPIERATVALVGVVETHSRRGIKQVPRVLAETTTSEAGDYELTPRGLSSQQFPIVHLISTAQGFGVAWKRVDPDANRTDADLSLPTEQLISGRLVDLEGLPAAGVKMRIDTVIPRMKNGRLAGGVGFYDAEIQTKAWPSNVTTDDKGNFAIRKVGVDHGVFVSIEGDDRFAPQTLSLNTGMAEQRSERDATYRSIVKNLKPGEKGVIPLSPAQIFEGLITFEDTGQPAAGARVSIWASQQEQYGSMASVEGVTDENGRYRITAKSGVRFGVQAYAPRNTPYLNREVRDIVWKDQAGAKQVDMVLPRGVLIKGRVVAEGSDTPVANASVQYLPEDANNDHVTEDMVFGWQGIWQTDEKGRFDMGVPPGPGTLLVNDPKRRYVLKVVASRRLSRGVGGGYRNYAHAIERVDPEVGETPIQLTLKLQPAATIEGQMVNEQGDPVEEAFVISRLNIFSSSLEWRGWPVDAAHGKFSVSGVPADQKVPVHLLDAKNRLGATVMVDASDPSPKVTLQPCGQAKLKVLNKENGKPVAGITPTLRFIVTEGVPRYDFRMFKLGMLAADSDFNVNIDRVNYRPSPKTDKQGVIVFPALVPGATYRIVTMSNGNETIAKEFVAEAGVTTDLGKIQWNVK